MMRLYVAPTFERVVKKLYPQKKSDLDEAVRTLASDPECGEAKVGDLFGIRVYKFVYQISCVCWHTVFLIRIV